MFNLPDGVSSTSLLIHNDNMIYIIGLKLIKMKERRLLVRSK